MNVLRAWKGGGGAGEEERAWCLSRYVAVILVRRLGRVSEAICSVPAEVIAKY